MPPSEAVKEETDKTGTLTKNEPTLREISLGNDNIVSVTGEGFDPSGGRFFRDGRG